MTGLRKHTPAPSNLVLQNLVDAGKSLAAAFAAMAADPTVEMADKLLAQLEGAATGVRQLRRQMVTFLGSE